MQYLTLPDIKKRLVIEHDEDDDLLVAYGGAAEEAMADFLGYSLDEIIDENGMLPKGIYEATIMLIQTMYNHRAAEINYKQYENAAFRVLTQGWVRYGRR